MEKTSYLYHKLNKMDYASPTFRTLIHNTSKNKWDENSQRKQKDLVENEIRSYNSSISYNSNYNKSGSIKTKSSFLNNLNNVKHKNTSSLANENDFISSEFDNLSLIEKHKLINKNHELYNFKKNTGQDFFDNRFDLENRSTLDTFKDNKNKFNSSIYYMNDHYKSMMKNKHSSLKLVKANKLVYKNHK